jgi:hypothetical protein
MRVFLLLVSGLLAACTSPDARKEAECKKACDYTMELALADIDRRMAEIGSPEMADKLRAELSGRRESDLKTCLKRCKAGRLDTACALAATSIEESLACTRAEGSK